MITSTLSFQFIVTRQSRLFFPSLFIKSLFERNLSQGEDDNHANREYFHDSRFGSALVCCSIAIKKSDKMLGINFERQREKVEVSTTIP